MHNFVSRVVVSDGSEPNIVSLHRKFTYVTNPKVSPPHGVLFEPKLAGDIDGWSESDLLMQPKSISTLVSF